MSWPFAPHVLRLLEEQVLIATDAQETLFLIVAPDATGAMASNAAEPEFDDMDPPEGFVQVFRRQSKALPAQLFRAEER